MKYNSIKICSAKLIISLILCNLLIINVSRAQEIREFQLNWTESKAVSTSNGEEKIPQFDHLTFDGYSPKFAFSEILKEKEGFGVTLRTFNYEPASKEHLQYLNQHSIEMVEELEYLAEVSSARDEKHLFVNLNPFFMKNGQLQKVTSFELEFNHAKPYVNYAKDFILNSALSNGSGFWYKISVVYDGIHKIDYTLLSECLANSGIDISSLNPNDINIFGNGEGLLPEANSTYRTDDLAKNAIEIVGGDDGSFDPGDYILFYARGPHRWTETSGVFRRVQNIYSDNSYYFINVNSADVPLRIGLQSTAVGTVTNNVDTYNYYSVHESDLINLVSGGQRWYGETFDAPDLIRNYNFSMPSPDLSSLANFKVNYAVNVNGGSNSILYRVNGVLKETSSPPSVSSDFKRDNDVIDSITPSTSMTFQVEFQRNSADALLYMDNVTLNARSQLKFVNGQLQFRDYNSVGSGNVASYKIQDLSTSAKVWDVTDWQVPEIVSGNYIGSDFYFEANADSLRNYVAFDGSSYYTPTKIGEITNQNLHGLPQAQFIIVSPSEFLSQANRLADLHREEGTTVHVVTPEQIYNEFSSGMPDATAIKFFAKMFYDRGAIDPTNRIENLLLFGDGTFDPKNRVENNNNFILAYEVANSESHISATVADDYYGLLDDGDASSASNLLDIGVGRLLISDIDMAREQVDKIEHYMKNGSELFAGNANACTTAKGSSTFGDWRTRHVMTADDEDAVFVTGDSEPNYQLLKDSISDINVRKIYLDAFTQVTTAGGHRYPDVVERINEEMDRGCLVFIYVGHGGEVGVAEERVITVPQIQAWDNIHGMPLMVSATCEFTKFDDPSRVSAGEWASLNPNGGAIALMTSTRSIFFNTNSQITDAFYEEAFKRDTDFRGRTFGEIISDTKNQNGSENRRSFTLIGDPALRLALPTYKVVTDSINSLDPLMNLDTMMALSKVTVKGHVEDRWGNILSGYNGVLYPTVYDKPKSLQTLQNDPVSPLVNFEIQNSKIYKGKASVTNGYFEFSYIVPKDIVYAVGKGKISYYGNDLTIDAIGSDTNFYVGGVDANGIVDNQGPDIDVFMNDENFVNGGTTHESPVLIVKIFDENGINASGSGIGHDLLAVLDNESGSPIVLNDYYEADLDSYQSGEIRFGMDELEEGPHELVVKVWDVNNNSSEESIDFVVQTSQEISIDHLLNYPNPFTTYTEFFFEHNQACTDLDVQVQIFTVAGRLVKTINESLFCDGFRSKGIPWDGKDDFGDQLAKGVYVYRVKVRTPDGKTADEVEKLVLLK